MNIMIFDTETTSLNKPFCYNIGYVIFDLEEGKTVLKRDFVVEQIWHNLPLFNTAYYAEKRPLYVSRMKGKSVKMDKYGYIMRVMRKDIKEFNIEYAYAFNSPFDERVFNYNCDWYKVVNPFDTVKIIDIRGFAIRDIVSEPDYKRFCDTYQLYTEGGNYSTNAENTYKYIANDIEFSEEHTALNDSIIETEILYYCYKKNKNIFDNIECPISIPKEKNITIRYHGKKIFEGNYKSLIHKKANNTIHIN